LRDLRQVRVKLAATNNQSHALTPTIRTVRVRRCRPGSHRRHVARNSLVRLGFPVRQNRLSLTRPVHTNRVVLHHAALIEQHATVSHRPVNVVPVVATRRLTEHGLTPHVQLSSACRRVDQLGTVRERLSQPAENSRRPRDVDRASSAEQRRSTNPAGRTRPAGRVQRRATERVLNEVPHVLPARHRPPSEPAATTQGNIPPATTERLSLINDGVDDLPRQCTRDLTDRATTKALELAQRTLEQRTRVREKVQDLFADIPDNTSDTTVSVLVKRVPELSGHRTKDRCRATTLRLSKGDVRFTAGLGLRPQPHSPRACDLCTVVLG